MAQVKGVDLLYHEATFGEELSARAVETCHSTARQAALLARLAGVKRLVIGHYSSRCRKAARYQEECRTIFPETYAAGDGDVFEICEKH